MYINNLNDFGKNVVKICHKIGLIEISDFMNYNHDQLTYIFKVSWHKIFITDHTGYNQPKDSLDMCKFVKRCAYFDLDLWLSRSYNHSSNFCSNTFKKIGGVVPEIFDVFFFPCNIVQSIFHLENEGKVVQQPSAFF